MILGMSSSLRDLYSQPTASWSFEPSKAQPNVSQPIALVNSKQWSPKPAHNSIFDLSPDLAVGTDGIDAMQLISTVTASAVLQYTSTAIAMPWEVGKLLLQVQWIPRDVPDFESGAEEDDDVLSESSNENEPEAYFADPDSTPRVSLAHPEAKEDQTPESLWPQSEDSSRPEYIIPIGPSEGVWGMMKRVGRFRGEGWLALWKGLLTSCITEVLSSTLQPVIHTFLVSAFFPRTTFFSHPPIILPIASHLVTGFLLSPLDLVRTRLIVQSFIPKYQTYTGPIDAFSQIIRHEGGMKGMYLHPQLFIPTLIDNTLRPVVSLALPGILAAYLGLHITEDANPVAWGFIELASNCLGLLITLPFETARRRLQVQARGTAKPMKGCVELRSKPYVGVVDTLWRILTEERSDLPLVKRARRRSVSAKGKERATSEPTHFVVEGDEEGWFRRSGIAQLYRGLGMRLGASAVVFVLALVAGGDNTNTGWAEL